MTDPATRDQYRRFTAIATRWMDNDIYGHLNNVVHYSLFDTAVNRTLVEAGLLDLAAGPVIGLVVESGCRYHAALAFPDMVHAGLRVGHLGRSSVRYEIGLFRDDDRVAAAQGHFVHVHVDRHTRRPVELPEDWRRFLATLA